MYQWLILLGIRIKGTTRKMAKIRTTTCMRLIVTMKCLRHFMMITSLSLEASSQSKHQVSLKPLDLSLLEVLDKKLRPSPNFIIVKFNTNNFKNSSNNGAQCSESKSNFKSQLLFKCINKQKNKSLNK